MSPDGNSILYVISKPDFKENVFDSDAWMIKIKEKNPVYAFTAEGYAVFMPNPRGSGGYGEKFRCANWKDWGYRETIMTL